MPMPRVSSSRRSRSTTRAGRTSRSGRSLQDNIRAPELVVGDMEPRSPPRASVPSALSSLCERYGLETVEAACAAVMDQAERLMRRPSPSSRRRLSRRDEGRRLLASRRSRKRDLPIVVTDGHRGRRSRWISPGTADQVPNRPINMPFDGTVDIAIWLTIRSILLDTAVHGPHSGQRRAGPTDHHRCP